MRDPRIDEFQALFNRGEFWESHEVLEGLWREVSGPRRELYQGLIQVAASLVHWQRHNSHGMRKLSGRAKRRLAPFGPVEEGLALRDLLLEWEQCLFFGGPAPVLRDADSVAHPTQSPAARPAPARSPWRTAPGSRSSRGRARPR